jgi:hemolysin activation/secretion protein
MSLVSKYYNDKGYVTTKAYLKPQDINDGILDITVLKGILKDIVHSDTNASSPRIKTAFIFQKNKILNLRDLETSLESVNRVQSSDASFKLFPGEKSGETIVKIETKKTFPVHSSLGVSGTKDLEDKNPSITASLILDNVFRINDIFTYVQNGSKIQKEYQSTKGKTFSYSFPIGSYIYNLTRSYTSYRAGIQGLNDTYLSNGDTTGSKLDVSKVLNRDQNNKFMASLSVFHKSTENFFINELIEVSSYKTTLFQASLAHTYIKNWGSINTTYTFHKGTDWFGAKDDSSFNTQEIDEQGRESLEFIKHSLDMSINYYVKDRSNVLSSNFRHQNTNDYLYNNDKLTVGSSYSVRGYSSSSYSGNNGFYFKNDFTKTFTPNLNKYVLKDISLYLGLDYGKVHCQKDNENTCGELYGSAAGIRTSAENFTSDFSWQRALKKINQDEKISSIFNYSLNIKF